MSRSRSSRITSCSHYYYVTCIKQGSWRVTYRTGAAHEDRAARRRAVRPSGASREGTGMGRRGEFRNPHAVRIDLPPGSYSAEFAWGATAAVTQPPEEVWIPEEGRRAGGGARTHSREPPLVVV